MTIVSNERISTNLPILDAENYDKWCKQMKVLFDYQDIFELIKNIETTLVKGAKDVQWCKHKEEKTKDHNALILIYQCVDANNFEKVIDCEIY